MGGSPVCLHRRKSTVIPGSDFRADPNTSTPAGKLAYSIFGAIAEFERELIRERVTAGLQAAKRRGERIGRRPALTLSQRDLARRLIDDGESPSNVARQLRVGRSTLYRSLAPGGRHRSG